MYLIQTFLRHLFQYVTISEFVMFLFLAIMKTPWDSLEAAYLPRWSLKSWICFAPCNLLEPVQIVPDTFGIICVMFFPMFFMYLPFAFNWPESEESNHIETIARKTKLKISLFFSDFSEEEIESESLLPKYSEVIEAKVEIESSPPKYSEVFEVKIEVENTPPKYSELFDATHDKIKE